MQIVIDIPESILNTIQADEMISREQLAVLQVHILKGIPLPKGHGRLKDENEIRQMIEDAKVKNESSKTFAENIIKFASTIIEADKGGWRCN